MEFFNRIVKTVLFIAHNLSNLFYPRRLRSSTRNSQVVTTNPGAEGCFIPLKYFPG